MTVTEREITSTVNGRVPRLNAAVSPPARARVPVTVRIGNWKSIAARSARSWWVWVVRPASYATVWRLSRVDPKRIPAGNGLLRVLWTASNWSDRLLWFALMLVAPSGLQGPLRLLAVRPTRRWGFYLVAAALSAAWLLGRE